MVYDIDDIYNIRNYVQPPPKVQLSHGYLDDEYEFTDLTTNIGREYHDLDLVRLLDSDDFIKDLAITGELPLHH